MAGEGDTRTYSTHDKNKNKYGTCGDERSEEAKDETTRTSAEDGTGEGDVRRRSGQRPGGCEGARTTRGSVGVCTQSHERAQWRCVRGCALRFPVGDGETHGTAGKAVGGM